MLYNIKQTNSSFLPEIRKYGCLFLCFAHASPTVFAGYSGIIELNALWKEAVKTGIISGDLNGDGDVDDDGEAIVLNHERLANEIFNMNVKYDGKHHGANELVPDNVKFVFGEYRYTSSHFVVLNKLKSVILDPYGSSNTVRNGKLVSMRWYYA